jgi:hypothetical protein
MRLERTAVLLGIAALVLVAASPATAKEGVSATLTTPVPLDAKEGERIRLAWRLAAEGGGRPFGASGIYVRLTAAEGAPAVTEYAGGDRGDYFASILVPKGGIGDIQIGLEGWRTDARGTRRADLIFPIRNDPLPGPVRASSETPAGDGGPPEWAWVLAAALVLGAYAAVRVRRQRLAGV